MLNFSVNLTTEPLIGAECIVKNCDLGEYTELGDHCVLEETKLGACLFCGKKRTNTLC